LNGKQQVIRQQTSKAKHKIKKKVRSDENLKVLIFVNYQGNQYEWDNLTDEEKKKMTEKLNQQTADQLGYEKEIIKN
jgi:hypothetical protein